MLSLNLLERCVPVVLPVRVCQSRSPSTRSTAVRFTPADRKYCFTDKDQHDLLVDMMLCPTVWFGASRSISPKLLKKWFLTLAV
jgi:hypothetical protein